MNMNHLDDFKVSGLATQTALEGRLDGETPLTAAVDHTVAGDLALVILLLLIINAADSHGKMLLLELGHQRAAVSKTENGGGFLLGATILKTGQDFAVVGAGVATATGRSAELVSDVHQVLGKRAFTGSSQVGGLLAGLGTAETAKAAAMDGRVEDDDFVGIESDADPVAGRVQLDEAIAGLADESDDVALSITDLLNASGFTENDVLLVDLNAHGSSV